MLARVVNYRPRGIGDIFNPSTDPNLNCGFLNFGLFREECWAQVASQKMWGTFPQVVAPPAPHAPATVIQDTVPGAWTSDDALLKAGEAGEPTRQAIIAAERAGTYNPAGNFPMALFDPMAWLKQNAGMVALVAGGGLVLFSLLSRGGRRR